MERDRTFVGLLYRDLIFKISVTYQQSPLILYTLFAGPPVSHNVVRYVGPAPTPNAWKAFMLLITPITQIKNFQKHNPWKFEYFKFSQKDYRCLSSPRPLLHPQLLYLTEDTTAFGACKAACATFFVN